MGQEVIIRVMHRGHGRVVRSWLASVSPVCRRAARKFCRGPRNRVGDECCKFAAARADCPRYVHRDFVTAGVEVSVESPEGRVAAVVSERPISSDAR